jgi:hypothetical protein
MRGIIKIEKAQQIIMLWHVTFLRDNLQTAQRLRRMTREFRMLNPPFPTVYNRNMTRLFDNLPLTR